MKTEELAHLLEGFPMSYADEAADKLRNLESINADLVEALKNMVENFGHGDMNDGEYAALQAARTALNKAGVIQ